MNQISIHDEVKGRLKSGNSCYHLVKNLLPSSFLLKKLKNKTHTIIILPVVLYECENLSLTAGGTLAKDV